MASNTAFVGSVPASYEKYLGPFLFEVYAKDIANRLPKGLNSVLETACGTGRVTRHLLNVVGDSGKIVATDFNGDMIAIAREKVIDKRIDWQVADAQDLPFDDNTFDAVVCQFGVMFFPDKIKAFAESYRVLKPGGHFVFNSWDSLQYNPVPAMVDKALKEEFTEEAPDFLEEGPFSFFDHNEINKLLQVAGFQNIEIEVVSRESGYDSTDAILNGFLDGTPLSPFLQEKGEHRKASVREKIREQLNSSYGERSDKVKLQAIVCDAVK